MVHLEREAEYADLVLRFLTDLRLDGLPYTTAPEHFGQVGRRRHELRTIGFTITLAAAFTSYKFRERSY
ncbi:hypothetical protein OG250_13870 [Streptomyces sp. NBC_00487]|uniref:hypothetical protein n=1 Tax=unclassified Streptomyces TaxID=2593676 RepID=UPI002E18D408|nr:MULTISPECIES: hypothetical protein [unclassified Streptomyces]